MNRKLCTTHYVLLPLYMERSASGFGFDRTTASIHTSYKLVRTKVARGRSVGQLKAELSGRFLTWVAVVVEYFSYRLLAEEERRREKGESERTREKNKETPSEEIRRSFVAQKTPKRCVMK
eukprot:scaffold22078_cov33-Tisochrysis_lutea.AAC.5